MKDIFLVLSGVLGWLVSREFLLPQIEKLFDMMDELDTEYEIGEIEEFTLNRIDIARDIHGIPENIIKEVNKMLYRLPM